MASSSQSRCVFVGNIPYDATEEQLLQICEEVGPVVSFRLVTDRETGKPKGYGFCEYKDEETALSARRNLLGYEINGRQLRVDFAENDKGSDKTKEQGRGGPGMTSNADPPVQKQMAGPPVLGDSAQQPMGISLATAAASVMAGALGGAQYTQPGMGMGGDPLTLHLAKMSRSHLTKIFSDLKLMATEDKESGRQLLLSNPQLTKALFQAQIMLGMVTPEMLQKMPNIRQKGSSQDTFQAPTGTQPHSLSRTQLPNVAPNQDQRPSFPGSSFRPKHLSDFPAKPQNETLNPGHNRQLMNPTASASIRPPLLDPRIQTQPGMSNMVHNSSESLDHRPSKLVKLEDGRKVSLPSAGLNGTGPSQAYATGSSLAPQIPKPQNQPSEQQVSQVQLAPDVESALLQQLMNLTPEQLSLLPPDQQQQVIQLQRMLR